MSTFGACKHFMHELGRRYALLFLFPLNKLTKRNCQCHSPSFLIHKRAMNPNVIQLFCNPIWSRWRVLVNHTKFVFRLFFFLLLIFSFILFTSQLHSDSRYSMEWIHYTFFTDRCVWVFALMVVDLICLLMCRWKLQFLRANAIYIAGMNEPRRNRSVTPNRFVLICCRWEEISHKITIWNTIIMPKNHSFADHVGSSAIDVFSAEKFRFFRKLEFNAKYFES